MHRAHSRRRGIALIDLLLLLTAVVLGFLLVFKIGEYRDMRYAKMCHLNQQAADETLWSVLAEENIEVPLLSTGYLMTLPDGARRMVLIFLPAPGETYPQKMVIDLDERHHAGLIVCPLNKKPPKDAPVVDYWFGAGRWWCLHNERHN
ncbi:MAG: hypothetical protein IT350_15470 [Deltaproteobacteria bacterium]|nr:hypothetical protein [Deltaproteobacteria bacterium]